MNVYEIITSRIIERLEAGTIPWRKPWTTRGADGLPRNLVSRRPYRGVNIWTLTAMGYSSPEWLTYRQADELVGHVRKGEHGSPVIFWKWPEAPVRVDDDAGAPELADARDARWTPILRYFTVFNREQCDGLPAPPNTTATVVPDPIDAAERIIAGMPHPPDIRHAGGRAYYVPARDVVTMPPRAAFPVPAEYYSTLFHELTHATGHPTRLDRTSVAEVTPFGSATYSREELVAEMGAAFICAVAGMEQATLDNSAAYLRGWLHALRGDARMVVVAGGQAQRAADYIVGTAVEPRSGAAGER